MSAKLKRPWIRGKVKAEVRPFQGAPTVFVNGEPIHFGSVLWRRGGPGSRPSLCKTRPDAAFVYGSVKVGGDADFSVVDGWLDSLFDDQPQAFGGLHLGLDPSRDWALAHLDDMPGYEEPIDWNEATALDASWASETWRRDSAALVEELVRHLRERYNGRVILYQVGAGACWENGFYFNPHSEEHQGSILMGDFSPVMLEHFRRRLRAYYGDDAARLRAAWSDPEVTFETAQAPGRMERLQSEWFCLRSPHRSQTADFFRARAEALEDCVLAWAAAVKRGSDRSAVCASPFGAMLDTGIHTYMLMHLFKGCFQRALESEDLDMFQSPASYILRDLGRGDTSSMVPLGSLRLHGKLWFRDFDSRTSIAPSNDTDDPVSSLWRAPRTPWEDVQMFKRDAGYCLLKGAGYWLHEIETQMFRLPEHIRAVRRLNAIGHGVVHADRATAPGLAVFVDPESNFRQSNSNRLIYAMNYEARQLHWAHAGMASEVYCVDEAGHPDMPPHKVLMVTNAFCLTDAQADSIIALARKNAATVIWLMAPGVQTPDGFDLDHVSSITGLRIRSADVEALARISLVRSEHPWSRPPLPDGKSLSSFGAGPHDWDGHGDSTVGPLFYADVADAPNATVLGLVDMLREPGLVVRPMDGYTSVYCAAPHVHRALLRLIGRDAGAHLYVDGEDLVHAAGNLLLVHARGEGTMTVRWPKRAAVVFDLYTGKPVAERASKWSVRMRQHETRLFFAGPKRMADAVRGAMRGAVRT